MSAPVSLGVILLCHDRLEIAARMARIWAEGGARVAIHVDAKAPQAQVDAMRDALADLDGVGFSPRHRCEWGHFSLVQATLEAARQLLDRHPDLTHVFLASGACLPLRPVADLVAFLQADPGRDHIESVSADDVGWTVGGLNRERFSLYFPFNWRRHRTLFDRFVGLQRRLRVNRRLPRGLAPHLGSQWWCLTARTLRAILDDPRRAEFDRYFRLCWIPDESYFQSLARRHAEAVESRSLTFARFDHQGRPYQLYDDHIAALEKSRCFVARKAWPGASDLLAHFPRPAAAGTPDPAAPRPERIERMIAQTVSRRTKGRPGLYMQSRFPRKDAENGKTSAPYGMFHGFSDLFPDFEHWLASRLDADVHGHLFGPEGPEFAGRPAVGPGGMPTAPGLRDRDPKGFLASLIRGADRMQVFQFSPRDNQSLNWFMATDPNAHLCLITGTWILPLLHSGMPFDDIRRMAAQLQRVELDHLDVLNSVWVKARPRIYDLPEVLARPADVLAEALHHVDPQAAPGSDLPAMRDLGGLDLLTRRLRNAGLQPRLFGDGLGGTGNAERLRTDLP